MTDRYKCPNCRDEWLGEHSGNQPPLCSDCGVETMVEMVQEPCQNCGGNQWQIYAPKDSIKADVTAECVNCGATPEIDDMGIWWR